MSLRELTRQLGEKYPQRVKHHLEQLRQKGLINYDSDSKILSLYSLGQHEGIVAIPIRGTANCGEALELADDTIHGVLHVSKRILGHHRDVFAVRAIGDSMDNAKVNGRSIDEGDYVLIDSSDRQPKDGDYVLSIIGGAANIKRVHIDNNHQEIQLYSESTKRTPPILIHKDDIESDSYLINGKAFHVIKER